MVAIAKKYRHINEETLYVVLMAYVRIGVCNSLFQNLSLDIRRNFSRQMFFTRHGDPNGRNLERWYVMVH